jgi:hypothetical protein
MPPDRSDEYRRLAAQCLDLARGMTDNAERARLVMMATQFFELSKIPAANLNALLADFNHQSMTKSVVQQQQQQQQPAKKPK